MKQLHYSLLLGVIAGIIDITPMIMQNLPWSANISAFLFWVVNGFMIHSISFRMRGWKKGLLVSWINMVPIGVLIFSQDPVSILPVFLMTTILGSGLGYFIDKK